MLFIKNRPPQKAVFFRLARPRLRRQARRFFFILFQIASQLCTANGRPFASAVLLYFCFSSAKNSADHARRNSRLISLARMTQWNFQYVQDMGTSDKKSCTPSCQPKKEKISAPRHDATMCKFSPLGWVLKGACDAPLPLAFATSSQLETKLRLRKIQFCSLNFSLFCFR